MPGANRRAPKTGSRDAVEADQTSGNRWDRSVANAPDVHDGRTEIGQPCSSPTACSQTISATPTPYASPNLQYAFRSAITIASSRPYLDELRASTSSFPRPSVRSCRTNVCGSTWSPCGPQKPAFDRERLISNATPCASRPHRRPVPSTFNYWL